MKRTDCFGKIFQGHPFSLSKEEIFPEEESLKNEQEFPEQRQERRWYQVAVAIWTKAPEWKRTRHV